MNEQLIKKFTSQCGIEYDSDDGADDESLRKYTELIIAECVDAVKTTAVGYTKNGEDPATVAIRVDGALGVSAEIARRFGVLK